MYAEALRSSSACLLNIIVATTAVIAPMSTSVKIEPSMRTDKNRAPFLMLSIRRTVDTLHVHLHKKSTRTKRRVPYSILLTDLYISILA